MRRLDWNGIGIHACNLLIGMTVFGTLSFAIQSAHSESFHGGDDPQDYMQTYLTPYQGKQAEEAILELLAQAHHSIRIFAYGFTSDTITKAVTDAADRGVDCGVVMDATEAKGPKQVPMVARLRAHGIAVAIGKSPVHNQLQHLKAILIDDDVVASGSLNYSPSGFQQVNEVDIIVSSKRAALFGDLWSRIYKYIVGTDYEKHSQPQQN